MNLKEKLKKLPSSPGVYLMKDSQGRIIYVGKSKKLKQRVQSYFMNNKTHSRKIIQLVKTLKDFDTIQTDTEFEAFLLECQLIQEIKPYFNRMLKNPHAYTYIKIHLEEEIPRISLTKKIDEENKDFYFGPFTSKSTVEKAIDGLKTFYKIDCQNPGNRKSPCLNHTLGLCIGICLGGSVIEQYKEIIQKIIDLLNGMDKRVLEEMNERMVQAADQFDFKTAGKYRDSIQAIRSLVKKEQVIEFTEANKNIVILEYLDENTIKIFLVKGKDVLYSENYHLNEHTNESLEKIIQENIFYYFGTQLQESAKSVDKEEIDEAQIIYSYLQSNNCQYFFVPKKWIKQKDIEKIGRKIIKLLSGLSA